MRNKKEQVETNEHVLKACLLAGKIMMQSGAETYRVEDTISRMASACGYDNTHSFSTPTGIIVSLEGENPTRLVRINTRSTDLEKVARVNNISRELTSGEITITEALHKLEHLENENLTFPIMVQILAAAVASASFLIMFKGSWADFIPAFCIGGVGFAVFYFIDHFTKVKFFAEFIAALMIGLIAFLSVSLKLGHEIDKIIIASVMPLVPGLLITNAVRDLMVGHFVSGLSKGAEALLTAFAIGAGVAVVFAIYV